MGVKKSMVCTNASSGEIRYTPASSAVSKPTSTFSSCCRANFPSTASSAAGLSLLAQPAALTCSVRRIGDFSMAAIVRDSVEFSGLACDLGPFPFQKKFLDPVTVEEIVECEMAKHDEDRVVTILAMLCRDAPIRRSKSPHPQDQLCAVSNIRIKGTGQIDVEQGIVGILRPRIVRSDHRRWIRKHVLQPVEEKPMHHR